MTWKHWLTLCVGYWAFAFRYVRILWDATDPNGVDQRPEAWGWQSAHMRREWARFDRRTHGFVHLAKNALLEYLEQPGPEGMPIRRGTAFLCAFGLLGMLLSAVCAYALGAIIH